MTSRTVWRESATVEVKRLAEKILDFLHEEDERRGHPSVPIAALYKAFEKEASYDAVQHAIRFLADRDLIAPFSYSLTAKGRRERGLRLKA
ncbi:MAG: hypothetical protein WB661_11760 [Candidatus Bathyarchaeia archaeon]